MNEKIDNNRKPNKFVKHERRKVKPTQPGQLQ